VTEDPDEVVWAAALEGNGEAFGRIFDRHRRRLYRHSYRLVPVAADADDIVAIVFFEAWRRRTAVRFVDGSILPWLLVIATNSSRNLSRSSRRYRALLSKLPTGDHSHDHAEDGDDEAHAALAKLSLADQQVIALCVLDGYSEREAATTLGIAPGTVKSRLSRAKTRLAKQLEARAVPMRVIAKEANNEA
jgi:RNA polymerase sigma factor (sigma-70 family)